jgi:hypothetical protein
MSVLTMPVFAVIVCTKAFNIKHYTNPTAAISSVRNFIYKIVGSEALGNFT